MEAFNYTSFRADLASILEDVVATNEPVMITRPKNKKVVVMSLQEFNSREETLYLMGSRANYAAILESRAQAKAGKLITVDDDFNIIESYT